MTTLPASSQHHTHAHAASLPLLLPVRQRFYFGMFAVCTI